MRNIHDAPTQLEVHDPDILANARAILDACRTPEEMQEVETSSQHPLRHWEVQIG